MGQLIEWKKYKLVLFDFDNTMYEPKRLAPYIVMDDIIYSLYPFNERKVRKEIAGHDFGSADEFHRVLFERIATRLGKTPEKVSKWYFNRYMPTLKRILKRHFKARRNLQDVIDTLENKGVMVGVLSDYGCVKERLEAIGIHVNEQRLWSTEEAGAPKPCPRCIHEIAQQTGIRVEEILMIGDRPDTDGMIAYNAGCDAWLVKTKKNINDKQFPASNWDDIAHGVFEMVKI